ncbi:MAG: 23S rRNA (adenine(2503)-C(2))-methyltransferase RlmN [Enterobacterales bacterium]
MILTNKKINLLNMNQKKMKDFFISLGEKPFLANQIMKWIYHYNCVDFNKMTNIKKSLRQYLIQNTNIYAPDIIQKKHSLDGTIKFIFKIENQYIESVYIPEKNRSTLCVSSQIGCSLKCTFCATAKSGFNRNLTTSEIIGQVLQISKIISYLKKNKNKKCITNIVMMGMGEPLLNLNNVIPAIEIMLDSYGFGLSKRSITISTSGVIPAIEKLKSMLDVVLAISLHAPNDKIRNEIMPINKKYNIYNLLKVSKKYVNKSKANKGKITIEYVMLKNVNDQNKHAYQLIICLKNIPCKINLIPWNSFPNSLYQCSSHNRIMNFYNILITNGFITTIRKIRGNDINAACGQLSGNLINRIRNKKLIRII